MRKFLIVLVCMFATSSWAAETIELTQSACQFVEAEKGDKHYNANTYDACLKFNEETAKQRLANSTTLNLKAGDYVFRVHNQDVPYVLGFWLRGEGFGRLTLPSVSGGGIQTGGFKDYKITLKEGEYVYSCPLNPTPDYKLIVKP